MKNKKAVILLCFTSILFYGFNSFEHKSNCIERVNDDNVQSPFQDSLKLLDDWKIDYGFNEDITLWGDTTYNLYRSKVRLVPGVAMEVLEVRSVNCFMFIKFTANNEIEKIQYTSLKWKNNKGKILYTKNSYRTNYFGFKIGDSLSLVLKKLKGVDYKIEKNYPSKKDVCISIHGLVKFKGFVNTTYDEYMCSYCFVNKKLALIEINYFRDVPRYQ